MNSQKPEHHNIREIFADRDMAEQAKNSERAIPKLIGSIGAIIFALGLIVIAVSNQTSLYSLGLTGIGLVMLIIFLAVDFRNVKGFLTARSTVYSANLMVIILMLLGILIVVNAVAANRFITIDLTEHKDFTLSQHSRNVISQLDETGRELDVIAFFRNDDPRRFEIKMLLDMYAHASPAISYKFVDYEINKRMASEFGIDRPSILLQSDTRKFVYNFTETGMTGGILSIVNPEKIIAGVVTGHGELSISDTTGKSISEFVQRLENENYIVRSLIIGADGIPDEVSILIIPGPKDKFDEFEIKTIKQFMERGGSLALFLEPFFNAGLDEFLADLGIVNKPDVIVDQGSNYFNEMTTPYIVAFLTHPITLSFLADTMAGERVEGLVMPTVTSLTIKDNLPPNIRLEALALTTEQSWGNTHKERFEISEGDLRGPIPVAVAGSKVFVKETQPAVTDELPDETAVDADDIEHPDDEHAPDDEPEPERIESRYIVIGDTDMLANTNIDIGNNYNLVLNSINWLSESEDIMGEREKLRTDRRIALSPAQSRTVQVVNILIPAIVAGFGVFMWIRRR